MRKTEEKRWGRRLFGGTMTGVMTSAVTFATALVLALVMAVCVENFSVVSHAESTGKVVARSAVIRKEPDVGSEAIASQVQDKVISIRSQVQGSDGYTWYEVFVDSNTLGYMRSDLVQITDGSTPPTGTVTAQTPAPQTPAAQTPVPQTPAANETPAVVTAVNPVSAIVKGGQSIRIRVNASTDSQIVTSVEKGMAVTVTGTATGADGKLWYQVVFISDGAEVTGFIRSDYADVEGELTPVSENPEGEVPPEASTEPEPEPEPEPEKTFDTYSDDEGWWLVNNETEKKYLIKTLFDGVETNEKLYYESMDTVKVQKIVIIILVILLVAAAAAVALLFFKIKDMSDAEYFNAVESEAMKRRNARPKAGNGQKTLQTVMNERQRQSAQGGRPAGAPQGQRQSAQGGRPAGALQGQRQSAQGGRPAGAPQGQRPVAQGGRPAGAPQGQRQSAQGGRPAGVPQGQRQSAQGSRPAGAPQGQRQSAQGGKPAGAAQGGKPAGAAQGGRPAEASQEGKPAGAPQGQRPSSGQAARPKTAQTQQNPGWQSKNFLADNDEFEFEFLNYDGDENQ